MENGALKGRAVRELWDTLKVARLGSAKSWRGTAVRPLCEKSSDVSALKSAIVSGNLISLFWWSYRERYKRHVMLCQ